MSWLIVAYCTVCVFAAAIVRGYSGFGFSLLAVSALSLALPTAEIVPSLFMLEVAASLHQLPGIWKDIHWRTISPLLAGCLLGTPFGVWLLANLPAPPMQLALGIVVLFFTFLLWRGYALQTMPGTPATVATGIASGLLNGAFSTGGPPVILFYFASPAGHAAGRASLIAYFLGTDMIGLPLLAQAGLIDRDIFIRALLFLPVLLAGVWVGGRSFRESNPAAFRRWVLIILMVLAGLTATRGLMATLQ